MSDYIKREDAIGAVEKHPDENYDLKQSERDGLIMSEIDNLPSADVIEVGKAYPREEFEKYGLSEWKDKHGQRWVMIERRENEEQDHE